MSKAKSTFSRDILEPSIASATGYRFPEAVAETRRPASAGGVNRSISMMAGPFGPAQAAAAANWWLWSFIRLCVAVTKRHSVRTADLPRR